MSRSTPKSARTTPPSVTVKMDSGGLSTVDDQTRTFKVSSRPNSYSTVKVDTNSGGQGDAAPGTITFEVVSDGAGPAAGSDSPRVG